MPKLPKNGVRMDNSLVVFLTEVDFNLDPFSQRIFEWDQKDQKRLI